MYMSRVRWQDRITNEEFRRRYGVENLEHRLRKMRCISHVKYRDENSIHGRAMELEVEGRRPVGRPKKTWSKIVEQDMRKLNITEDMAEDKKPRSGKLGTLNEDDDSIKHLLSMTFYLPPKNLDL